MGARLSRSGGQDRGGRGSGGRHRPLKDTTRVGQAVAPPSGMERVNGATPRVGVRPTQATMQRSAVGGQGNPSQDGQCWEHSAPLTAGAGVGWSAAASGGTLHASTTVGSPVAMTARQASRADRTRKRFTRVIWLFDRARASRARSRYGYGFLNQRPADARRRLVGRERGRARQRVPPSSPFGRVHGQGQPGSGRRPRS